MASPLPQLFEHRASVSDLDDFMPSHVQAAKPSHGRVGQQRDYSHQPPEW
jgi:hypothetical protein